MVENGEPGRAGVASGVPSAAAASARKHDAARELDLEGVVAGRTSVSESDLGSVNEGLAARRRSCKRRFGFARAPGFGGHGAQSDPGLAD